MKRRLQLMPEVLPAPNKVESGKPSSSAVRERTMARLRVLAAVGTSIAAACGGSTTGSGSSSSGGSSGNGGPDGGLPDANKPDSDPGYGVVDPLPPPACFKSSDPPKVQIFPSLDDAGAPDSGSAGLYGVDIQWPDSAGVAVGDVKLQDGSTFEVEETRQRANGLEVVIRQTQSMGRRGRISIQASCAAGPTRVTVYISESPNDPAILQAEISYYGG